MIFCGQLSSLTDTVQGLGRAGRGRRFTAENPAECFILWCLKFAPNMENCILGNNDDAYQRYEASDQISLTRFLSTNGVCLNSLLSLQFDSIPGGCFGSGAALCSVCALEIMDPGMTVTASSCSS